MAMSEGRQVAPTATRSSPGQPTWNDPTSSASVARGYPAPGGPGQRRQGWDPQGVVASGLSRDVVSPEFSRGGARVVQNFGKVLYNPIGAGVLVKGRIKPQNSKPGNYQAGAIFWTAQAVPTTVKLTGLQNAQALAAVLGPNYVQAAVRVNG